MLAAFAAGAGPGERIYQLRVRAPGGTTIALRARGEHGWLEAFCTAKTCSLGRTVVVIPSGGTAIVKFDVFRTGENSPHRSRVRVTGDIVHPLTLDVTIP